MLLQTKSVLHQPVRLMQAIARCTLHAAFYVLCSTSPYTLHMVLYKHMEQEHGLGLTPACARIRLQPLTHAVAASLTYGCSLFHIRLQLFEATVKGLPLVCVNVVGGGYDFGTAKPMLLDLGAALPQAVI